MGQPDSYNWSNAKSTDPEFVRTTGIDASLVNDGYAYQEVPDQQDHNTLFRNNYLWQQYLNNLIESQKPAMLYSSGTATWNGSTGALVLAANLDTIFRTYDGSTPNYGEKINRIAAGTLTLADGECLVLFKQKTGSSGSATVLSAVAYASLASGTYAIVASSSMASENYENEIILFRRRGSNLECPLNGLIYATGSTITFGQVLDTIQNSPFIGPVGTIYDFYDFNGALTFDTNYFAYCDGSTVNVTVAGVTVSRTLPDLSNRYTVGFGTEGGGDIDTAAWSTSAVGNASHQVNLQHSHTVNAHTHDVNIASFTSGSGGSHAHDVTVSGTTVGGGSHDHGGITNTISNNLGSDTGSYAVRDNGLGWTTGAFLNVDAGSGVEGQHDHNIDTQATHMHSFSDTATTDTEAAHTHAIDPANTTSTSATPGTDSQLSTTQSIQPRSIRVRKIMRIK